MLRTKKLLSVFYFCSLPVVVYDVLFSVYHIVRESLILFEAPFQLPSVFFGIFFVSVFIAEYWEVQKEVKS